MNEPVEQPLSARDGGFRFERVILRELRFEDKGQGTLKATPQVDLTIGVSTLVADDNSRASVTVTITVEPKETSESPSLTVALEGVFVPASDESGPKLRDFVTRQGPTLLVPFLRELIANITSRARSGPILLPPINLYAIADLQAKTKA